MGFLHNEHLPILARIQHHDLKLTLFGLLNSQENTMEIHICMENVHIAIKYAIA